MFTWVRIWLVFFLLPLLHVLTLTLSRVLNMLMLCALFYFTYHSTGFLLGTHPKTLNFILCPHLVTFLHWPVWPLVFLLSNSCLLTFALPFPPLCLRLPLLRRSCCGSQGSVTLWGTCGWWVAPGLWLAASLGVACVTTPGGFWVVHDDSLTPCDVLFLYQHRPLTFGQESSRVWWNHFYRQLE